MRVLEAEAAALSSARETLTSIALGLRIVRISRRRWDTFDGRIVENPKDGLTRPQSGY